MNRSELVWSLTAPTESGWYWVRDGLPYSPHIIAVVEDTHGELRAINEHGTRVTELTREAGYEWGGPISRPAEGHQN